jgi:hypothetical protein
MKIALFLVLLCGASLAGSLEEYAAGQGRLESLLKNEQLFILTPSYKGKATLVYQRDTKDKESPAERELHFTAFTPDGSRYSEPDCPHPKLPAIVEATPLDGHGFGTGAFAYSADAPTIESLSGCTTIKELKEAVPDLVRVSSEGPELPEYFFNWFSLSKEGLLNVVLLSVECGPKGTLKQVKIWRGTLSPSK